MKTMLDISAAMIGKIKQESARRGQTMSEVVEMALRTFFQPGRQKSDLPPLPEFSGGGCRVNLADRDGIYNAMTR
jgi:hypothetical protein